MPWTQTETEGNDESLPLNSLRWIDQFSPVYAHLAPLRDRVRLMRIAGLISGTSHDGIDVAVVDFQRVGPALEGRVVYAETVPYSPALRRRIVDVLPPMSTTLNEVCQLDTLIGQAFADVVEEAAEAVGGVDAVCSQGQTVFHWVEGAHARGTLQLGQPAWIAERLGVPVVADVRIRDITVGGHGAPLASFIDDLLLRHLGRTGALNLGGISNVTIVDGGEVTAFDIGPANALIDALVMAEGLHPRGFDEDGRIAKSGHIDPGLLEALLSDPYYSLPIPKSTGKEQFHLAYVRDHVAATGRDLSIPDIVATLTELTVRTVVDAVIAAGLSTLVISGGGCRNPVMVAGLRDSLDGVTVILADDLGAPADSKEAILFALIGWCTLHGLPGIVAGGTGARELRILGTITPGAGPLDLPEPQEQVASLRLTDDRAR